MPTLQNLSRIFHSVTANHFLDTAHELYLVGGAVRDSLLGVSCRDFDLISPQDPSDLAKRLARKAGGSFFFLDEARRQSRVMLDKVQVDFAPFRAPSLEEDLRDRDFTVNALALSLRKVALFDPCDGQRDLQRRLLRPCTPHSLSDDPLRHLRAVRFAHQFGFEITAQMCEIMRNEGNQLLCVAHERIRAELGRCFSQGSLLNLHRIFTRTGLDRVLCASLAKGRPRMDEDSFFRFENRLLILRQNPTLSRILETELEAGVTVEALLRLCTWLCRNGSGGAITEKLPVRFGNKVLGAIRSMEKMEADSELTSEQVAPCADARALWMRRLGSGLAPVTAMLFHSLNGKDEPGCDSQIPAFIDAYLQSDCAAAIAPLVRGEDVTAAGFRGPDVGRVIEQITSARIRGEISTREDAVVLLRSLAVKQIDK